MLPIVFSGLLGFAMGDSRTPRLLPALGAAGLLVAERASGLPVSVLGLANVSAGSLVRGVALGAAFARFGFWGAVGAHLAYEVGGVLRSRT